MRPTLSPLLVAAALLGAPAAAQVLCPDGSYVAGDPAYGTCVLAPDGTYVPGPDSRQKRRQDRPRSMAGGFQEGAERARIRAEQRRAREEAQRLERERLALEAERVRIERERLELERQRATAAPAPPDAARPPSASD